MVEEILVVGDFQIDVGIVFVVAHHLIGRAGVVAAARFLTAAARCWVVTFLLDSLVLGAAILEPDFHLSFGEVQILRQLFALGSDDVVILLESVLQLEQLAGREGRPDTFRFAEGRE